jgi:hypothetical protein
VRPEDHAGEMPAALRPAEAAAAPAQWEVSAEIEPGTWKVVASGLSKAEATRIAGELPARRVHPLPARARKTESDPTE